MVIGLDVGRSTLDGLFDIMTGMNTGAYVCDSCGKGIQRGNLVSHAKNRVKRVRKPNLHAVTVLKSGKKVKVRLCTSCLRKANRPGRGKSEK